MSARPLISVVITSEVKSPVFTLGPEIAIKLLTVGLAVTPMAKILIPAVFAESAA